ncbi:MAG: DUF354 domain-containing protein [Chitinispirillaceae bacterium]|nr:DUF354 domain-containing protein [Chitinispirillaceae bacterium]
MIMQKNKTIWIDLDNTPHVVFFKPIIRELESRGYHIVVSARDCFQVCGLADLVGIKYSRIGKHYGKNKLIKGVGLIIRSVQMIPFALKVKPLLALSHGSRSQLLLSKFLRLKSIVIYDYEHSKELWITKPTWHFAPKVVTDELKVGTVEGYYSYPGIKEDVYVPDFVPDESLRRQFGISREDIMVTIRPPATEAHYHNPEAEQLLRTVIKHLIASSETRIIMLPRNDRQKETIVREWHTLFADKKIRIPLQVVDGLNLIWNSDLVISGGGTMNREAAALLVPVYSIFRGPLGSVDRYLEQEKRLFMLRSEEEVVKKIIIRQRDRSGDDFKKQKREACNVIINNIVFLCDTMFKSNYQQ